MMSVFAHTDNMVAYLQSHNPDQHLFVGHLIHNVGPIRFVEQVLRARWSWRRNTTALRRRWLPTVPIHGAALARLHALDLFPHPMMSSWACA